MKAYAYLRVSGKGQAEGDGFTRQEEDIRRYAKKNRIEIVKCLRKKASLAQKAKPTGQHFRRWFQRSLKMV